MMLENIRIILVNTSHTGNIGSAARAMKTKGLSQLVLVDPVQPPDEKSTALAAGANDILTNLRIVPTLAEAISAVKFSGSLFTDSAEPRCAVTMVVMTSALFTVICALPWASVVDWVAESIAFALSALQFMASFGTG